MLKWAVNGPRGSYLQSADSFNTQLGHAKSCGNLYSARERHHWPSPGNENHITSTPIYSTPGHGRKSNASPRCTKARVLQDISENTPKQLEALLKTPPEAHLEALRTPRLPPHYATTLPTFDEEYSPCGLIPGPILALRGLGIPDSYFEKPRYLSQDINDNYKTAATQIGECEENSTTLISDQTPVENDEPNELIKSAGTLFDCVIDTLLESAQRERRSPKRSKYTYSRLAMSPTYTPADDPASDLLEAWHTDQQSYQERYVHYLDEPAQHCIGCDVPERQAKLLQLRRQFSMRRKRKFTRITTGVRNSASKLCKFTEHRRARHQCKWQRNRLKNLHNHHCDGWRSKSVSASASATTSDDGSVSPFANEIEALRLASTEAERSAELEVTKRRLDF